MPWHRLTIAAWPCDSSSGWGQQHDQIAIDFAGRDAKPHLYNTHVEKAINTIFDEIEAALVRRDRVELRGFGVVSS